MGSLKTIFGLLYFELPYNLKIFKSMRAHIFQLTANI